MMSTTNTINSTNTKDSKNNSVSDLARQLVQDLVP